MEFCARNKHLFYGIFTVIGITFIVKIIPWDYCSLCDKNIFSVCGYRLYQSYSEEGFISCCKDCYYNTKIERILRAILSK